MGTNNIGILAFGSLIKDPGEEICPLISDRIKTETPFSVEYARRSNTRGGAPTLVPVKNFGKKVNCEILVLDVDLLQKAKDLLYRRETRKEGSGENYNEPSDLSRNKVLVKEWNDLEGIEKVIYTDFPDEGKFSSPNAEKLSEAAISSFTRADEDQDGITYLKNAMESGVFTALTEAYKDKILEKTNTKSLTEALEKLR